MYGYIYKFTIIPTGHFYVGKHKYKDKNVLDEGYFGSGIIWSRVLSKYDKKD